jgi:anaerobic selenocysteine-containing dehydrogenase
MLADPDINHARHCLEQAEFLVVQDIFLSETARISPRGPARRVPSPRRTAPSPPPTGGCSACARRSSRPARRGPIGRSSAIWRRGWFTATRNTQVRHTNLQTWKYASPADHGRDRPPDPQLRRCLLRAAGGTGLLAVAGAPRRITPARPTCTRASSRAAWAASTPSSSRNQRNCPMRSIPSCLTTGRMMFHFHTGTMTRRSETPTGGAGGLRGDAPR